MSAEPIRFEVTRDKTDYWSGIVSNYLRSGRLWPPAIFVVALSLWFWSILGADAIGDIVSVAGVYAGGIFALLYIGAWQSSRQPGALDAIEYSLSPEALQVKTSIGSSETKWLVWKSAFETNRMIVIRGQTNVIHILPKRQISAETQHSLRQLLTSVLNGRVRFHSEQKP